METQSLVTIVPWTFIATLLNLLITMLLVKKFLFKPINEILEKRRRLSEQELTDARAAKEEAKGLKAEYETSLSEAREEAVRIVQNAQKEAAAAADKTIKEAQQQAEGIRSRAEADIAQERKKALNEAKNEIGGLAMDIAGKVVEREIHEEDHKKLIDEFLDHVGEAS